MRLFFLLLFAVVTTTSFASSDLELKNVTSGIELNGPNLRVQLSVSNHGQNAAQQLRCRLTLYSGQQVLDSAVYSLLPLASDESRNENIDWKITATNANALGIELYDEVEPDEHPFNNFVKSSLRLAGQSKTDLEIVDVTFPSEQKMEGKTAEFRVLIRNQGPLDVKSSVLKINLLQYQQPVASAEKKLGLLEPGDEKETKVVLRLPGEGISVEQVLFEARCEIKDTTVEDSDSTNNIVSKPLLLSIRMPDLIVKDMRVDNRGNLAFWVVNKGSARSLPSVTALYVNGALVRRYSTPELAASKSRRHVYGGTKVPGGTQVSVVADYNADLTESSEENNRLNFTVPSR